IRYRAFIAVVFAALGGLLYLNRDVFAALPDLGLGLFLVAFLFIFDVGAAILVELIVLPRKQAGIYDGRSRTLVDYFGRLIPFTAADRAAYAGQRAGYWLAVASTASACVAMVIGFINLWVRAFGPSIFGGYIGWLGLDAAGFQDATLDPHSHMIALAIVAMTVAVVLVRFGVLDTTSRMRRTVARVGAGIAIVGVIGTSLILGAVAFLNFAPPTLFTNGPDGVNGIAGDDLVMTIVFLGAIIVAAAVISDPLQRRNGLRLTILGTWVASIAITVVEGIFIELHELQFGGSLAANDAAFASAHPMTGIFLMLVLSLGLLLVDFYGVPARLRRLEIGIAATGLIVAFVGTTLWTFVDPTTTGPAYGLYLVGIVASYLAVLVAGLAVRSVRGQGVVQTTA
ncbi:MAG: hypothetical protein ACXWMN_01575, partial [Candidatus Limnocylindria bacterium]